MIVYTETKKAAKVVGLITISVYKLQHTYGVMTMPDQILGHTAIT